MLRERRARWSVVGLLALALGAAGYRGGPPWRAWLSAVAILGFLAASGKFLRLGDLDHLIVVADVDETEIGKVQAGEPASIAAPLLPQPIPATVSRIAHEVHRESRASSDILIGRDARIIEVDLSPQQRLPEVIGAEVTVRFAGLDAH